MLAGGVAHDFNNYIHAILGHVDLARLIGSREKNWTQKIDDHLCKIITLAEKAGELTKHLSDAREGVSHSLCSLEFENHRPLYNWFLEKCDIETPPRQIEFARMNVNYTLTSKRKCLKLVNDGLVVGWDDPRMATICGMRRRGYPAEAIRDFCEKIGVSKAFSVIDMALLESCVRDNLNLNAERAMAVLRPVEVVNHIEFLSFVRIEVQRSSFRLRFHGHDERVGHTTAET